MAKASTPPNAAQPNVSATPQAMSSTLDERAWELFARNVNVCGIPTMTHDHLAAACFKAAAAFEAVAGSESSTESKG